jgi:integrase
MVTKQMKGIYPRGGSFLVKKRFPGHDKRISATFATREAAEAFLLKCEVALKEGQPLPPPKGVGTTHASRIKTLGDIFEEVLTVKWEGNRTGASADNGRQFVSWSGKEKPVSEAFTLERINAYLKYRKEKGNGGTTLNKKLSAVRVMMEMAFSLGLIPTMTKMPRQKQAKGRLRYYTVEEQRSILHWTRQLGYTHWADLWQFLVDTGARPSEARRVRWGDFRAGRVTFEAPDTKTELTRTIPLTTASLEALARRREDPQRAGMDGPFSWAGKEETRRMWDRLREFIPWLDEHTVVYTFRHTCASRLAMAGSSAPLIKNWMGHTCLTTTERYMHLAPAAVDNLVNTLEGFKDPTFERRVE